MAGGRRQEERGAVAILFAAVAVILFVLAAMVVDIGLARDTKRQSQNAADASALAAANALYPNGGSCTAPVGSKPPCITDAVDTAKSYAVVNFGVTTADWTSCPSAPSGYVVAPGSPTCISFDSLTKPTKVWAVMPTRNVKTGLGVLAGVTQIPVSSDARAALVATNNGKCTLCFLGDIDAGNADFTVNGGSIHINGNSASGPNAHWTAVGIGVVGSVSGGIYSPAHAPAQAITDPWAARTDVPPSTSGLASKSDPCADGPGVYGSLTLPNSTCTLASGLYVVTGTWEMKNNTKLKGTDVTIYAKGPGGYLDFKNGEVTISAPTVGVHKDLAIVYDRTSTQNLSLQGNGGTSIKGGVYLPNGKLDFNGNSCFGFDQGPIIANGVVKANGNKACVTVTNAADTTIASSPPELGLDE